MKQAGATVLIALFLGILIFAGCAKDDPKPRSYKNEAVGVSFTGPRGWHSASVSQLDKVFNQGAGGAGQGAGLLIFFTKHPFGSTEGFNPNISLSVEDAVAVPGGKATPHSVADSIAGNLSSEIGGFRIVREPSIVIVNGREGASFIYEGKQGSDFFGPKIKACVYVFLKESSVFIMQVMDKAIDFEETLKDFEDSLNSLRLK